MVQCREKLPYLKESLLTGADDTAATATHVTGGSARHLRVPAAPQRFTPTITAQPFAATLRKCIAGLNRMHHYLSLSLCLSPAALYSLYIKQSMTV